MERLKEKIIFRFQTIFSNFRFWVTSAKQYQDLEKKTDETNRETWLILQIGAYNGAYRQLRTAFLVSSYLFIHFYTMDGYFHRSLFFVSLYLFYSLYITKTNQHKLFKQLEILRMLHRGDDD